MSDNPVRYTHEEWIAEAERRFGADAMKWKFICPSCHHIASVQDWKDAGAPETAVGISCVGRYVGSPEAAKEAFFKKEGGPCNYAGYGLFRINPVIVEIEGKDAQVFNFAPAEKASVQHA